MSPWSPHLATGLSSHPCRLIGSFPQWQIVNLRSAARGPSMTKDKGGIGIYIRMSDTPRSPSSRFPSLLLLFLIPLGQCSIASLLPTFNLASTFTSPRSTRDARHFQDLPALSCPFRCTGCTLSREAHRPSHLRFHPEVGGCLCAWI